MIGAQLHVGAADILSFVPIVGHRERDLAARVGGSRQLLDEIQRRGAEPRRVDAIADEAGAEGDLPALARGRSERREVARQHRGRGHERDVVGRRLARPRPLIGGEEEHPVPDHRTAERPAVLIALQAIVAPLAVGADRRKRTPRVEPLVADELESIAREPIGARLGDGVHRRGRMHAALRRQAAGRDAEFLQRVGKRERQAGGILRIVVDGAVERIRHAEREPSGHRDVHASLKVAVTRTSRLDRRAGQHDQIRHLPALERQLDDPRLVDDRADARAADVHERRRGFDGDGFLQVADAQRGVDRRRRAHLQHDARLQVALESLE